MYLYCERSVHMLRARCTCGVGVVLRMLWAQCTYVLGAVGSFFTPPCAPLVIVMTFGIPQLVCLKLADMRSVLFLQQQQVFVGFKAVEAVVSSSDKPGYLAGGYSSSQQKLAYDKTVCSNRPSQLFVHHLLCPMPYCDIKRWSELD